MKIEISEEFKNEIIDFIDSNNKDDIEAFALVEEMYNAIVHGHTCTW